MPAQTCPPDRHSLLVATILHGKWHSRRLAVQPFVRDAAAVAAVHADGVALAGEAFAVAAGGDDDGDEYGDRH